jgi:hypothetical protein
MFLDAMASGIRSADQTMAQYQQMVGRPYSSPESNALPDSMKGQLAPMVYNTTAGVGDGIINTLNSPADDATPDQLASGRTGAEMLSGATWQIDPNRVILPSFEVTDALRGVFAARTYFVGAYNSRAGDLGLPPVK